MSKSDAKDTARSSKTQAVFLLTQKVKPTPPGRRVKRKKNRHPHKPKFGG